MIVFAHRINTVKQMSVLPEGVGAEIDIRDYKDKLVAAHDAYMGGELFEDVISVSKGRPLIVNVKCEGIEDDVIGILSKYKTEDYFLLDCTFSAIVKLCAKSFTRVAIRFSEFEGLDTLVNMKGKAGWVWADCFTKLPFDKKNFNEIKNLGYKICLVSPDLLGRPEQIDEFVNWFRLNNCMPDAVCVKMKNKGIWM
jgi:hypothetical protein